MVGGRGCVVRHGLMAFAWGDQARRADVASACKPVFAHFLFRPSRRAGSPASTPVVAA